MIAQQKSAFWRMLLFSGAGLIAFFIPFQWGGKSTILFDHLASFLLREARPLAVTAFFAMMLYGALLPFIRPAQALSRTEKILNALKLFGLIISLLYVLGWLPAFLRAPDMVPFLYEKLGLNLAMIIPIGALVLALLIGFGLLEMVGVLLEPLMRRAFKTPGHSAIDAVASFVGSYSVGLLMTDQMYRSQKYSAREAAIIATGFSTVSAAFMVVVAKTLNLMDFWNFYFWSTLLITFAVTAITARMPPLSRMDSGSGGVEKRLPWGERLRHALDSGLTVAAKAQRPGKILMEHFLAGLSMAAAILPSIMGIGLAGLLLAKYSPLFDVLGVLLYPFTWLMGLEQAWLAAKALASGLAEMFLPAILLKGAALDAVLRYVVGVVSVSSIIFFSGLVPCILATRIPLNLRALLLIWLQRSVLSIVLAAAAAHLAGAWGWLA